MGGIPEWCRQQLAEDRKVRQDFLSTWRYRASFWEVYVAVENSNIVDHMKQDYQSRGGWAAGVRVPLPP